MNKNRLTTIEMPKALRDALGIVKAKPLTKAEQKDVNKKAEYKAYLKRRAGWCKAIGYPTDTSGASLLVALQSCIKSGNALWSKNAKDLPRPLDLASVMAVAPSLDDCIAAATGAVEKSYNNAMTTKSDYVAGLEEIVAFNKAVVAQFIAGEITSEQMAAMIAEGPTDDDDDDAGEETEETDGAAE